MIPPTDLMVEIEYPNGKGGQHAGTPRHNIVVTHVPTGIKVSIPDLHRSQHLRRTWAIEAIESILTHPRY